MRIRLSEIRVNNLYRFILSLPTPEPECDRTLIAEVKEINDTFIRVATEHSNRLSKINNTQIERIETI